MISKIKNIYAERQSRRAGTINTVSTSVSSASRTNEEATTVEIIDTNPPPEFGLVDKQRHFGILRYTVTNRFRKLMLIALVNLVVVFAAIFLFVFFLILHLENRNEGIPVNSTLSTPTIKSTAGPMNKSTNCSPKNATTLIFAYSNDLTSDQVLNTWHTLRNNLQSSNYDTYSYGRLDVNSDFKNHAYSNSIENIDVNSGCKNHAWSNSIEKIEDDIIGDLSNAAESYPSYYFGSNILSCIRVKSDTVSPKINMSQSIFESEITKCGTKLYFLVKRLPNDTDVSDIVSLTKHLHVSITFVVSDNPSGGMNQQVLNKLATKTNGFCIFAEDYRFQDTPIWLPTFWPLYLVYSVNAEVTKSGNVTLPSFDSPLFGDYHICMTLQDYGPLDTFRMVNLMWFNAESSNSGFFEETLESHAAIYGDTTYIRKGPYPLGAVPYHLTLRFEYSDDKINILQIRIYSVSAVDFWVPYND